MTWNRNCFYKQIHTRDMARATLWLAMSPQKSPIAAQSKSTETPQGQRNPATREKNCGGSVPQSCENQIHQVCTSAARTQRGCASVPGTVSESRQRAASRASDTIQVFIAELLLHWASSQPGSLQTQQEKKTLKKRRRGICWQRRHPHFWAGKKGKQSESKLKLLTWNRPQPPRFPPWHVRTRSVYLPGQRSHTRDSFIVTDVQINMKWTK